jgi:hypothetical protein
MRFMVVIHPQFPVPPEAIPALVTGFVAWWDRYRDRWEAAGFFAGGNGGGGICTVDDAAALQLMMLAWPFAPFSQITSHALVDMDTALEQWQAVAAQMAQPGA